jgi:multimeric flavodoxin WrbA
VVVIEGSPKGRHSITRQYVDFLARKFPQVCFDHCPVGSQAPEERWPRLQPRLEQATLVLWASPVYSCLVPAQLKEFVEWIEAAGRTNDFAGKYAAQLTTSARFFDHTAQEYLRAISEDWQMGYVGGHSAEMLDLLTPQGQAALEEFFRCVLDRVAGQACLARQFPPRGPEPEAYQPGPARPPRVSPPCTMVVTDQALDEGTNLAAMAGRLGAALGADVVDLSALPFEGCCGNVFSCGRDHTCPREDRFVEIFREQIMAAEIVIFAGQVRDRFLSEPWKRFMDRALVGGHIPSLAGKQLVWLLSGPLRQVPFLRQVLQAQGELQMAHLVDIVTDEEGESSRLDRRLDHLADELVGLAVTGYVPPPTFLGVAGMKMCEHIVRRNASVFRADLPFFRRRKGYQLPSPGGLNLAKQAVLRGLLHLPQLDQLVEKRFSQWLVLPLRRAVQKAAPAGSAVLPSAGRGLGVVEGEE